MKLLLTPILDRRHYPDQKEVAMTSRSTLGPITTLVLTLTITRDRVTDNANRCPAGMVKSFLFARFLNDILRKKPAGNPGSGALVFCIGSAQECQTVW